VSLAVDATAAFDGMLNAMRHDDEWKVASMDALILQLGQTSGTQFGGEDEQFSNVRSKMRQVAKLLLTLPMSS